MSGRRSRGRRRVGDTAAPPQASQSRLRAGVSDPHAVARRNERRLHCLRTQPEGPGLCRQGPDTLHRSLAMELRPLGLPPWCVDQQLQPPSPGRNDRYGARDDAQHPQQRGPGTIHGADPRAPLPRPGARATASRTACAGPKERSCLPRHPLRLARCACDPPPPAAHGEAKSGGELPPSVRSTGGGGSPRLRGETEEASRPACRPETSART